MGRQKEISHYLIVQIKAISLKKERGLNYEKITALFLVTMVSAMALAGCGSASTASNDSGNDLATEAEASVEVTTDDETEEIQTADIKVEDADTSEADNEEEATIEGTIEEIKDFMFTIVDAEGTAYGLSFEEKPEGLDSVSDGDSVIVTYTGKLEAYEAFTGEIISVEKAK